MAAYSALSLTAIDEPVNLVFDFLTTSLSTWLLAGWISVLAIKAVSSSPEEEDEY
ncbi:MAG: hypothetical protein Q9207_006109 [Kuettlingeria erythrocarpa]